jgi:hypothetical protein
MRRAVAALLALTVIGTSGLDARDEQLPGWFDLAVPGGTPTLEALGMTLEERAFTLPVLARGFYDRDQRLSLNETRLTKLVADIGTKSDSSRDVISVPAPLAADVWRELLPPVRPPATHDLFIRLVSDRNALLVAVGLMSTHDSVRAWLARDRESLRFLYQQAAGAFVMSARRLHVVDDHIVTPGGARADAIWEALAGESPARPGAFLRALLTKDQGRLAWYYDTIGGLEATRLAAVWPDTPAQLEHATSLYVAFRDSDPQWRVADQPFRRSAIDAWMVLTQNAVADGSVASPLPQATWALLFDNARVSREQVNRTLDAPRTPVSMAWLAVETMSPILRERRSRFEMFRIAQHVFRDVTPAALPDVALAVSGVRQFRSLLLALERMQISEPDTWAAAVAAARHVTDEADDHRTAVTAFQGALAVLERVRHARTIDRATTARLVRSLSDAVRVDKRAARSISQWIVGTLVPALPRLIRPDAWTAQTAYESTILQALAGPAEPPTSSLEWEGLTYVIDPVAAEHERLRAMRAIVPSPGLDAAIASERPRALADALTALVYASALGDPEGAASLSPDVGARHEFGFGGTALIREELPWSVPEERQGFGAWRVQGALLGLDLALSRLFLRRIADQQMPAAPSLTLNDLATLARTGVVMVGSELTDADRDALAAAIVRGRTRVAGARSTAELVALGRECGMSDTTRQLLTWIASRQREAATEVFSLRDLLWLGRPALSREILDRWGVAGDGLHGPRGTVMPGPAPWEDYAGRSEAGQVTTQVPDLTLRLVEETARMKLPAVLIPSLLGFAVEDYWHDVRARFADDWPRLTRQAARLSSSRIHDYVAALAGNGPLRAQ